jgi:membrane-associated progesterone receptor component
MASILVTIVGALAAYIAIAFLRALYYHYVCAARPSRRPDSSGPNKDVTVTLEELEKYTGQDGYRPLALAIRGKIYDVSSGVSFYGADKPYGVYAGREVSRALGKMSLEEKDCTGEISDLTDKERQILEQWESKFASKYPVIGRVVPSLELDEEELAGYDGRDESRPMLLAIRGIIFDVSHAKAFYGPDGAYPFAGKECARALGKYSVELEDCNGDVSNLTLAEMDALRSWEAQFQMKYKIAGKMKR